MFGKKNNYRTVLVPGKGFYDLESDLADYICKLEDDNEKLMKRAKYLESELRAVKPIIKNANYEPAMSRDCGECKFVVRSKYSGDIIGCRKNGVCSDFEKEKM